ncbi:probable RNA-binding protein 18 [Hydra vulgaris]|uniref:Probable RNA-binding protein 18 n=1 Tax=Hydra vulgaris TaxID=6087 RepID=A0ABM4DPB2_HYDVU
MGTSRKLWIGNIDKDVSQYQLLQLVKTCGVVKLFDFVYHTSGPLKGEPRGFCFIQFEKDAEANRALVKLNGLQLQKSCLKVDWARDNEQLEQSEQCVSSTVVLTAVERETQIKALERKLNSLAKSNDENVKRHPVLNRKEVLRQQDKRVKKKPYDR